MSISTEHILQCNQSEPLADASGMIVDVMNENDPTGHTTLLRTSHQRCVPSGLDVTYL